MAHGRGYSIRNYVRMMMQDKCHDEDVDYMSDAFLKELGDVRPGLLSRGGNRKNKIEKKSKELPKSKKIKLIEEEARDKGLSLPITSENKGFAMLKKMGYKEGTSLGKSGDGKRSLVPIIMKDGKSGLGRRNFVLEKATESKIQETLRFTDFRHRKQVSQQKTKILSDLWKSKLTCQQLDTVCGYTKPVLDWYWPAESIPKTEEDKSDEEDDGVEMEPSEQLKNITLYLRVNHFYCIWCGTAYKDEDDLQANCPGDNEEAHE